LPPSPIFWVHAAVGATKRPDRPPCSVWTVLVVEIDVTAAGLGEAA
jgi:hypothetical protein